ncbi:MAG TPA: Crp/Fnr family transcriptional regulator [bacterium (Candidatus Stahlbacteria)]|nr:Crp/Fnr family transcriptional regulator [Candidatus Stahlbacteria bacterium]
MVAEVGREKILKSGEVLFREGDPGDQMYLIRSGKIKITKGEGDEEKVLAVLKEGDFFGEMAIIDGSPRSASALAVDEVKLIIIDKDAFFSKIKENPLIEYVLETLTRRLRAADEQIKLLMIKNEERRVVAMLLTRAKESGKKQPDGSIEVPGGLNYEYMGNVAGVDQEKVKLFVERLIKVGLLKVEDNRLLIKSIPELEDYLRYISLKERFEKV